MENTGKEPARSGDRGTQPAGLTADERLQWAQRRTSLAGDRTDWARQRTELATERTFSAWVRTGLAAVTAGLGIARLLGSTRWPWLTQSIGVLFVLAGGGIYAAALWRYRQESQALSQSEQSHMAISELVRLRLFTALIGVLLLSAALSLLLLVLPSL